MTIEESELISKAQNGDMNAFEKLINRYDKNVLAIVYSFKTNKEDAKDIYQEVFIRVFKGLNNFEGKSEFSTWLYRITANVCLTFRSKQKKMIFASIDESYDSESDSFSEMIKGEDETDKKILNEEIANSINSALDSLSPQQKMVFTLKHQQEFKIKEIADMLNCSEGTIKKSLFTATQKMKEKLKHWI